jgi:hypothetical protein
MVSKVMKVIIIKNFLAVRKFFIALFTIYFNHYWVLSKCDIGFTRVRGTSTDVSLFFYTISLFTSQEGLGAIFC